MNLSTFLEALLPGESTTLSPEQVMAIFEQPGFERLVEIAMEQGEQHNCDVLFDVSDEPLVCFTKRFTKVCCP